MKEAQASMLLVAWRPGAKPATLPAWLHTMGVADSGGAWVFALHDGSKAKLQQHVPLNTTLNVGPQQCKALLAVPVTTTH